MKHFEILTQKQEKGIELDPRTKLILLVVMTTLILGRVGITEGITGDILQVIAVLLSILPFVLLFSIKKYKIALIYLVLYSVMTIVFYLYGNKIGGLPGFLLLGSAGIITRLMPSVMLGVYVVATTTVSEFAAAMQRMKISEKIIIPLSVMFRFFPTLADEYSSINAAMRMRGVSLGGASKAKMLEYRIIPLMVCSAKIGEELSVSALTRGLGGNVKRTNMCRIGFQTPDVIAISLCLFSVICLALNLFGVK